MPSRVIHVWTPLEARTLCGLWYKGVPAMHKPNVISKDLARKIIWSSTASIVCRNCVHILYSNKNK